jgi:hypothetical protein
MSAWTTWHPTYRAEGVLKAATAVVSVWTAIRVWPTVPRLAALPSPDALLATNAKLLTEVEERRAAEAPAAG